LLSAMLAAMIRWGSPAADARSSRSMVTVAGTGLGCVLLLSGCQFSFHAGNLDTSTTTSAPAPARPAVPKADVEQKAADGLRPQAHGDPVSVSCPADLPMEVGATMDCVVTRADKRYALKLEVTEATPPTNANWTSEVGKYLGPAN